MIIIIIIIIGMKLFCELLHSFNDLILITSNIENSILDAYSEQKK